MAAAMLLISLWAGVLANNSSNLAEFESQALHAADKSESVHVAFGVSTESTLRSWRSREQCIALVESNRVNAETDLLRDDANLHGLGSLLDATPWSIVQSQGHSKRKLEAAHLRSRLLTRGSKQPTV